MTGTAGLRSAAEGLAAPLPPLLAEAEHLAATVLPGAHGRRRPGMGDEFWQYRAAGPTDPATAIDWRRSGRSDAHFVRQTEWQASQTVVLWADAAQSMGYSSAAAYPPKGQRARLLAMALAVLLVRGGERVGLSAPLLAPRGGEVQLGRLAHSLAGMEAGPEYGAPALGGVPAHARAVFLSDFLGDPAPAEAALTAAADRGVKGAVLMVLDPGEEAFPFDGRTIFESMSGALRHETLKAGDLRRSYCARLAERKARLGHVARLTGWRFHVHHTGDSPLSALLWLYRALEPVS